MSLDQFKICSKIEPKLKKIVKAFHVFDDYKGLNVLFIKSNNMSMVSDKTLGVVVV